MRFRTASPAIGVVLALGSAAGCGGEEMFLPELGTNEHLIETSAAARLASADQGLEQVVVVGDLDGDGIDDAIVRSSLSTPGSDGKTVVGGAVHVLYGGSSVTGSIDLTSLPTLIQIGPPTTTVPPGPGIAAVGDVDGDGLADFVVSVGPLPGCGALGLGLVTDSPAVGGVYLVYGSATRLTGSHPISDVGALLNDPVTCAHRHIAAGLGDIDGDGKADFAIGQASNTFGDSSRVFVFYGSAQRLSGTVDLAATADAVISDPGSAEPNGEANAYAAGDVDGDGFADFIVRQQSTAMSLDARVVRGSATRLSGAVTFGDIGHTELPGNGMCFTNSDKFAVALGDLDGDGADDFSVVSCEPGQQFVFGPVVYRVFYGRKGELPAQLGPSEAAATLAPVVGPWDNQLIAGDVDGDGIRDLILADQNLHDGNGGVHIIKGRRERLSGDIDPGAPSVITYVGQSQRVPHCTGDDCIRPEKLGGGVSLGDLTGDHHPDLLIGGPADEYEILPGPGGSLAHTYVLSSPVIPKP